MFRFYSDPIETGKGANPATGRKAKIVRITVVGKHENGKLSLAVARCSKKDCFVKKTGRAIAEGRLAKGKTFVTIPMDECDIPCFVYNAKLVAHDVAASTKVF